MLNVIYTGSSSPNVRWLTSIMLESATAALFVFFEIWRNSSVYSCKKTESHCKEIVTIVRYDSLGKEKRIMLSAYFVLWPVHRHVDASVGRPPSKILVSVHVSYRRLELLVYCRQSARFPQISRYSYSKHEMSKLIGLLFKFWSDLFNIPSNYLTTKFF